MKEAAGDVSHVAWADLPDAGNPAAREVFVDLLRFVAAVQMLQGHTIAALLSPHHRAGIAYAVWSSARGLTSVAFLFAAGLSFYFANLRSHDRVASLARMRRGLWLIVLGYVLHAPSALLFPHDSELALRVLRGFWAVDILQCIGVSLIALEALAQATTGPRQLGVTAGVLGTLLLLLARFAPQIPGDGALAPLLAYVTARGGSSFPLLPWSAHILLGVSCAALLHGARPGQRELRLIAFGCGLLAFALLLQARQGVSLTALHVTRLACVVWISAGLVRLTRGPLALPSWITALSRETLFLYVFHILLVYGQGVGLADRMGGRFSPTSALPAALLVVAVSCGAALALHRSRGRRLAATARTG